MIMAAVKALRPKQWVKNILVFAAPAAAGLLSPNFAHVAIGFVGFACASSFGYVINDWIDRENDSRHPKKQSRPFASKKLGLAELLFLLALLVSGIVVCCAFLPVKYSLCVLTYGFITISYSIYIKNIPVTELIWLALGFLIRAIAGSAIIEKSPTGWFVVAVFFGAIYVVTAKRIAELRSNHSGNTRQVLEAYALPYLNIVLTVSMGVTLLTYALWVFAVHSESALAQMTIIPFTLAVLLYAYHAETDKAEAPEDLILKDPSLIACAIFTAIPLLVVFSK